MIDSMRVLTAGWNSLIKFSGTLILAILAAGN